VKLIALLLFAFIMEAARQQSALILPKQHAKLLLLDANGEQLVLPWVALTYLLLVMDRAITLANYAILNQLQVVLKLTVIRTAQHSKAKTLAKMVTRYANGTPLANKATAQI